jgi:porin
MTVLMLTGMAAGSMSALFAEEAAPVPEHAVKVKKKTIKHAKWHVPAGPIFKDAPKVAEAPPQIPPCSQQSAYEINKTFGIKYWDFPPPNMGDSLLLDRGCWRTNLAKLGFGFLAFDASILTTNMLNHYVPPSNGQQYAGQRTTGLNALLMYLSYDLGRWGLPDGQFLIQSSNNNTTDAPGYTQNTFNLAQLAIYGTLFNRAAEYEIGYFPIINTFQGNYIGGNVNNPLGPSSTVQVLVGGSFSTETTPAASLKWHFDDRFYNTIAIIRSTPGANAPGDGFGSGLEIEHYTNHAGLGFANRHPCVFGTCYPSPRELFIDEIGYKNEAAPGSLFTWLRAEGYYNTTRYYNFQANNGSYTDNGAFSIFGDQQIWQAEPDSPHTAYKGVYVGATFGWNKPQVSAFSQDYEARIYSFGLFGRPRDQIALSFQHLVTSPYLAGLTNNTPVCLTGLTCIRHASNNYNLTYTANILTGVYASIGVQYVDHPAIAWSPVASSYGSAAYPVPALAPFNIQGAVNFLASIFTIF